MGFFLVLRARHCSFNPVVSTWSLRSQFSAPDTILWTPTATTLAAPSLSRWRSPNRTHRHLSPVALLLILSYYNDQRRRRWEGHDGPGPGRFAQSVRSLRYQKRCIWARFLFFGCWLERVTRRRVSAWASRSSRSDSASQLHALTSSINRGRPLVLQQPTRGLRQCRSWGLGLS